jgi:N-acetylglucosamine repressor
MLFVQSADEVCVGHVDGTIPEGTIPAMGRTERTDFQAKATHAQTRAHNAALVLRALYDLGPISRADIARLTGLTRTSVGELVSELEKDGLATEVGRGPSTGGKQPTLVALNANSRTIVTLDLGERTFTAALANLRGELAARTSRDLEGRDGEQALQLVHELIDEVRAAATTPILGIGVGTPGIVDQTGTIRWAVSLDWQDLPLAQILQERHDLPTVVANDSRAAAFATYLFKGDLRPPNLAVIKVGRGIGAGLILKDQLFGGDNEAAGEIGHVVVDRDGDACHCGRYGCLETVASAPAIIRHTGAASLEALAARARQGDEAALGAVRTAGRALGGAIAYLVATLDVRHISLVGTMTTLGDPWLDAVRDEATSRSLAATGQETVIENGGSGEDVTLLGACALLLTRELGLTVHR